MNLERERERWREREREEQQLQHQQTVYNYQLTDGRGDVGFRVSEKSGVLHDLRVECRVLFPVVLCHAGRSARGSLNSCITCQIHDLLALLRAAVLTIFTVTGVPFSE